MRNIRNVIAASALAAAAAITTTGAVAPAPAEATTCPLIGSCFGGVITHGRDDGYDQPILVICKWGDAFYSNGNPRPWSQLLDAAHLVAEGTNSKADCGIDTDVIVVRDNEEVHCGIPMFNFDATGPHKVTDAFQETCHVMRD